MRYAWLVAISLGLAGCPYMTKSEFDEAWDNDGDGFGIDEDCDDTRAWIYPGAPDFRGDGCDADCGVELDTDGDDWPDDSDCAVEDPDIFPCAPETVGDGLDSDCGGATLEDPEGDDIRETGCRGEDPRSGEELTPVYTASCDPL